MTQSAVAPGTVAHLWQRGAGLPCAHTTKQLCSSACCIAASSLLGSQQSAQHAGSPLCYPAATFQLRIRTGAKQGGLLKALPSSLAGHLFASLLIPPVRERPASVSRSCLELSASGTVKSMVAAMAASISCRPAPLRVFAARRPAARPMRASRRVFAAVDKASVRLWVFLRGNVPKCSAFRPAERRQIASSDTYVRIRRVTRSGSCSACADCSINFTQLTVYALGKRPVAVGKGKVCRAVLSAAGPAAATAFYFACCWTASWACDREYSQAWHL